MVSCIMKIFYIIYFFYYQYFYFSHYFWIIPNYIFIYFYLLIFYILDVKLIFHFDPDFVCQTSDVLLLYGSVVFLVPLPCIGHGHGCVLGWALVSSLDPVYMMPQIFRFTDSVHRSRCIITAIALIAAFYSGDKFLCKLTIRNDSKLF